MASIVPLPRRPLDSSDRVREWYENELGWRTLPGPPALLGTGLRFDVLDVPAEAGFAALRHLGPGSPVALHGGRVRLLVAAGSAEELPGLLAWLDWGTLDLDLTAIGTGGHIEAPLPWPGGPSESPSGPGSHTGTSPLSFLRPPREGRAPAAVEPRDASGTPGCPLPGPAVHGKPPDAGASLQPSSADRPDRAGPQGVAVWLRPPEPGCEVESSLPTLSALGGGAGAPDLVRLVDTVATWCHRIRLRRLRAQTFAFS